MKSQGSAYGRFRRALDRGNMLGAMSAAAELDHVRLGEALELVLLLPPPTRTGHGSSVPK